MNLGRHQVSATQHKQINSQQCNFQICVTKVYEVGPDVFQIILHHQYSNVTLYHNLYHFFFKIEAKEY